MCTLWAARQTRCANPGYCPMFITTLDEWRYMYSRGKKKTCWRAENLYRKDKSTENRQNYKNCCEIVEDWIQRAKLGYLHDSNDWRLWTGSENSYFKQSICSLVEESHHPFQITIVFILWYRYSTNISFKKKNEYKINTSGYGINNSRTELPPIGHFAQTIFIKIVEL